jgi:peptidyl-prolyl cis-trans isomerase C
MRNHTDSCSLARFGIAGFFLALLVFSSPAMGATPPKEALLIANGKYSHFAGLAHPGQDAAKLSEALEGLGFRVRVVRDGNREQMLDAIVEFERGLHNTGAIAFFHYGGHGVQVDGKNYLLPADADIPDERRVATRAVALDEVMTAMDAAAARASIIVIDACRDNPLPAGSGRNLVRGLSVVGLKPKNSIVIYAAEAGSKALDGLFTPILASSLQQKGRSINQIMMSVRSEVYAKSSGKQTPGEYNQLFEELFLGEEAGVDLTPETDFTPSSAPAAMTAEKFLNESISEKIIAVPPNPEAEQKPSIPVRLIELPEVVATINGKDITRDDLQDIFNAAVKSSGMNVAELTSAQQLGGYTQLLNDLIDRQLLLVVASKEEVSSEDVAAEIKKFKSQFPDKAIIDAQLKQAGMTSEKLQNDVREELKIRRWMESQVTSPEVSEAEVKSFYESNLKEFEQPETVKASHILFMVDADAAPEVVKEKQEAAQKAAARAKAGEDFTALAKELSEEPGASESGGDLGFFPKDRMVPEFANAAFAANLNDISAPVKTQFGWHVIKVTDKKAVGTVPFDEVDNQITSYLKSMRQREAVQKVMKDLKDSAKIQTFLPAVEPAAPAPAAASQPASN